MTQQYPTSRPRRNRTDSWLRDLVSENTLTVSDLIYPLFVRDGKNVKEPVEKMPGVFRYSIDTILEEVSVAKSLGIKAIALFPYVEPEQKSNDAIEAIKPDNLICRAIQEVKNKIPEIGIVADVALDPYTTHGHDGIVVNDYVDNDLTLEVLSKQAITLAKAGTDIIAPSDMMDGRIAHIRRNLDAENFLHTKILSYAVKYASSLYGPFRSAIGSDRNLGKANKATYQMNIANSREAMREVELDISEGADAVMVKPGIFYLDIIRQVRDRFSLPLFAYQVGGEYAMLRAAEAQGMIDFEKAIIEAMICFKRAGADAIFTYAATDIAKILNSK
jgi:porphobilinogen synthase